MDPASTSALTSQPQGAPQSNALGKTSVLARPTSSPHRLWSWGLVTRELEGKHLSLFHFLLSNALTPPVSRWPAQKPVYHPGTLQDILLLVFSCTFQTRFPLWLVQRELSLARALPGFLVLQPLVHRWHGVGGHAMSTGSQSGHVLGEDERCCPHGRGKRHQEW